VCSSATAHLTAVCRVIVSAKYSYSMTKDRGGESTRGGGGSGLEVVFLCMLFCI
jgi:hypothetical protein